MNKIAVIGLGYAGLPGWLSLESLLGIS